MVDGELRGCEWKSLKEPNQGQLAVNAGYQSQFKARKMVDDFCKEFGKFTIDELESNIGRLCKRVYSEAVSDAGVERPLYMRVDFLFDRQGRVWLGERESWGADLNGNDLYCPMDPSYKELVTKMIKKTKYKLHKSRKARAKASRSVRSPSKRKRDQQKYTSPSKRACIKQVGAA